EQRLLKVITRLEEAGLKLSFDKCQFCRSQVTYVGHIVSEHGIATDPDKVEAVKRWKQPTDLSSLQSFLGFCGYYRRFIKNYSIIVRPLTELCKGYPPTQKKQKSTSAADKTYYKVNEPFGDRWDQSCSEAFQKIIHCLTNAPVLAFGDPTKPYILHIDASCHGLGAVLNQEYPEGLRPVAFASRKLSASEKNYPVHQLEFLALKWAVVDKFHDYLYGAQFTVRTDNNPLTYILTTAKLNATGHRWLSELATYHFTLQYRPGSSNIDADALSRNPLPTTEEGWQTVTNESVQALCKQIKCCETSTEPTTIAESLGLSPDGIPECFAYPVRLDLGSLSQLSHKDLVTAQDVDSTIAPVKQSLRGGPSFTSPDNPTSVLLKKEASKLFIQNNLLYRKVEKNGTEVKQLVLPRKYVPMVLRSLHDESGHLGVDKTIELIRSRFYWPKMGAEVEQYIKNCGRCITRKAFPQRAAPLKQITSQGPLDLVCIDFLSLEPDSQGFANILVVTDHFTRYAQAFPAKDQKATTVAKILCERYFVHYGLPARIHSDQGRDFESKLIQDL
uniref:Gypsy retrotransposon integrase-like protein 1 n=1 Tax=Sinocyclocheilus rhinocerous TaxID=307959 RepID=A0A673FWP3_9TELE